MWEKDKLEIQLKNFKDKNTAVVYGNSFLKNEINKKIKKFINYTVNSGYVYEDLIKNYNVGILTAMIKSSLLKKSKIKFNNKYNIIGDFDFFLRISKIYKFKYLAKPIATYRIHENNLSSIKKSLQIKELKNWLKSNEKKMGEAQCISIKIKINQLQLIDRKFSKNFFITFLFFIKNFKNLLNLKNIFILFMPKIFLKKLIWFS